MTRRLKNLESLHVWLATMPGVCSSTIDEPVNAIVKKSFAACRADTAAEAESKSILFDELLLGFESRCRKG